MGVTISSLTAIGTLAVEDLFEVVDDPSGTPLSRKATGQQVVDLVSSTTGISAGSSGQVAYSDGSGLVFDADLTFDGANLTVGSGGGVANAAADNFVIDGGAADAGLTIFANSATGRSMIFFGESGTPSSPFEGRIDYLHTSNTMEFTANASKWLSADGSTADFQSNNITTSGSITSTGADIAINRNGDAADASYTLKYDNSNGGNVTWDNDNGTHWSINSSGTASDDFRILRYDNDALQDVAFLISNSTGDVTIANNLTVNGDTFTFYNSTDDQGIEFRHDGTDVTMDVEIGDYADNFILGISNPARNADAAQIIYNGAGNFTGTWSFWLPSTTASVAPTLQFEITNSTIDAQDNDITTTGNISTTGGDMSVVRTGADANLTIQSNLTNTANLLFSDTGSTRWRMRLDLNGDDFEIGRWVAGVYQDNPLVIDNSSGDVTIANDMTITGNTLTIQNSGTSSGGTANTVADNLILTSSGNAGMSISTGNTSAGYIHFDDSDANARGRIIYDHSANRMEFYTNGGEKFHIDANGADFGARNVSAADVEVTNLGTPTNYTAADDFITTHLAGIDTALASAGGGSFPLDVSGTDAGPSVLVATFENDSASPAAGDEIYISYVMSDSAGNQDEYARWTVIADDETTTTEDTSVTLEYLDGGSLIQACHWDGGNTRMTVGIGGTITPNILSGLVVDNGGSIDGISIQSSGTGHIYFADAADDDVGRITYNHSGNQMEFWRNATQEVTINSTGVTINQNDLRFGAGNARIYDTGTFTYYYLDATADRIQFTHSSNLYEIIIGNLSQFSLNTTEADFQSNNVVGIPSLYLEEQASAAADTAGEGQLWVKSDTPNRIMFTDDAGTDIDLQTGYELLATGTLSGSTAIDISSYTAFRVLKLVVIAMTVTGDGDNVTLDASFDGGSTWASDSWSKTYQLVATGDSAVTAGSASAAGDMYFSGGIGNAAGEYANTTMYLYGATQSAQTWVTADSMNINTSGTAVFQQLQGLETTVDIIDQIRITQANIDGGTYHLYGIRN